MVYILTIIGEKEHGLNLIDITARSLNASEHNDVIGVELYWKYMKKHTFISVFLKKKYIDTFNVQALDNSGYDIKFSQPILVLLIFADRLTVKRCLCHKTVVCQR